MQTTENRATRARPEYFVTLGGCNEETITETLDYVNNPDLSLEASFPILSAHWGLEGGAL